jgi:hypothetical protein
MQGIDENENINKKKNGYQNGYVYYLYDPVNKRIYIGSSKMSLSKRLSDHKYDMKAYLGEANPSMGRSYRTSFNILIQNEYLHGILEKYPCDCRKDLEYREFQWIQAYSKKDDIEVVNIKKNKIIDESQLHHSFYPLPLELQQDSS